MHRDVKKTHLWHRGLQRERLNAAAVATSDRDGYDDHVRPRVVLADVEHDLNVVLLIGYDRRMHTYRHIILTTL